MNMRKVLRVENVGKSYRLGEISRGLFFDDLRSRLTGRKTAQRADSQLFWALRNVSFDIQEGEVVGLLGRNGAGKSTLLKIVSQITSPTQGTVKMRGRVASLLEVGTGFHVELTGRDNVFLNGMILGMTRREVARKFDEIVEFSGVEKFIDTPVKRYSVGMRVRLAFAVAAHLEAEILLIDEVLAVGDAVFQQKCLGKIGQVSRSGRTVLFVSHDAAAIQSLCTRGIVLENGTVAFDGGQEEAIEFYAATRAAMTNDLRARKDRTGSGEIRVVGLELRDSDDEPLKAIRAGDEMRIALQFERSSPALFPRLAAEVQVSTHLGAPVFTQANWFTGDIFGALPERGTLVCRIPRLPLPAGHYHLSFRLKPDLRGTDVIDALECARELHVESGDFFGSGKIPPIQAGVCLVEGDWQLNSARGAAQ
jgi:lipopolysaccharide transport system ATP-binding protein